MDEIITRLHGQADLISTRREEGGYGSFQFHNLTGVLETRLSDAIFQPASGKINVTGSLVDRIVVKTILKLSKKRTEIATATEVKVDNTIAWSTLDSSFVPFRYHILRMLHDRLGYSVCTDCYDQLLKHWPNVYLALENNLEIVLVVNKIDLPGAEPEPKASSQGD
ncbi:hypothetical protein Bca52824_072412 [Brassica carinata]|uniref:Uncharacterized protein n=3 Tax=Brassica TaxID=3705 RepID=A0A8X7Q967_BRACI|nr:hypothetical protein Bca52824_072412 [Brassica carinata]